MAGDQKKKSRMAVLDVIRQSESIARIDVAQETGISQATVTTITAEMLREGLIETVPSKDVPKDSQRGRPRVDLKLRGAAHIVAGIKLSHNSASIAIVDFEGTVVAECTPDLGQSVFEPSELGDMLHATLSEVCETAGMTLSDLSAVGIGMAGVVDATRGFVYWSPLLNGPNIDLQTSLEARLQMPVLVDNDANLVAMAELYFGEGKGVSDFLVVTVESGVGMGVVIENKLYRGTRGCGGEFGHTKVQLDGALCRCGQRGCLEAYVADYALLREAFVVGDMVQGDKKVAELLQAAREGDLKSKTIVTRASRMFAMGLANLINIFDPELIILAGERMQMDHLYAEEVIASVRDAIVKIDRPPPKVVIHKWGDLMWARGAAAFAIDAVADIAIERLCENAD